MKNLRINDGKGEFSLDGVEYKPLDELNKDDLLALLDIALNLEQEMEMDEYDSDVITHPAHKIIYKNIHDKLKEVVANKQQFTDDANELYQEAYDKYKVIETEPIEQQTGETN